MQSQNVLAHLDQQAAALSKMLNEQMAGSFEKVISTDEGKEILRRTYRDELIGLWEELPSLEIETLDHQDLETFIQKMGVFLRELKKSIQYPHRKKVNNQFVVWQRNWDADNTPWLAFLENCTDQELDKLDALSSELMQLDVHQSVVHDLMNRWLKSEFSALAQMEKSGVFFIQWVQDVLENTKDANEFHVWLVKVGQTSQNIPNQLGRFLAGKWLEGKANALGQIETFSHQWKITTYFQNWSKEWKNFLEKLHSMGPILPLLNQQEIGLFEKYYRFQELNLDALEIINKDIQTIYNYRERLKISELLKEWPKLEQPGFVEVANLITSAPEKKISNLNEKDTPGSYIVHLRELLGQVPEWQEEFKRVTVKITQIANSWYIHSQNRGISQTILETISRMMASCVNIENMADLVTAHNLLVYVQEDMKGILTANLGEFTSKVFRDINSLLDQSSSVSIDEILGKYSEPEVEQAIFILVRQNLIKLEIKR